MPVPALHRAATAKARRRADGLFLPGEPVPTFVRRFTLSEEVIVPASNLLEEALDAWGYVRDGVIAEIENVADDDNDRTPAEGARSIADLARHILASGRLMAGELGRPDGDFTRLSYPELMAEHTAAPGDLAGLTGKAALVAALRADHAEGERRLRQVGEIGMLQTIRQFNGRPATRLSWMHHGLAHEEYHRGQIALSARLLGHVPALTKLIHGG